MPDKEVAYVSTQVIASAPLIMYQGILTASNYIRINIILAGSSPWMAVLVHGCPDWWGHYSCWLHWLQDFD